MPRVKRAVNAKKKRRKLLKRTKGFLGARHSNYRAAKEAMMKAESHAYKDRKAKKRTMRRLWQVRINAAVRQYGLSYSKFIHLLKEKNILIDRKILSKMAAEFPVAFGKIMEKVKEK